MGTGHYRRNRPAKAGPSMGATATSTNLRGSSPLDLAQPPLPLKSTVPSLLSPRFFLMKPLSKLVLHPSFPQIRV